MCETMKAICPYCKSDSKVIYLGVIVQKDENNKLFRCEDTLEHSKILYFKVSKLDGKSIQLLTADDEQEEYELYRKRLLTSRLKCPKHKEHFNTSKDHEYKYVVAMGNKNRFYCRNHSKIKRSKHSRYEFRFDAIKKDKTTLEKLLISIDEEYYKRLQKIYSDKTEVYDIHWDSERLIESLVFIGISDDVISKIFHVDRSTIYRLKKKKQYEKEYDIKLLKQDRNNRLFYSMMRELQDDDRYQIIDNLEDMKVIE